MGYDQKHFCHGRGRNLQFRSYTASGRLKMIRGKPEASLAPVRAALLQAIAAAWDGKAHRSSVPGTLRSVCGGTCDSLSAFADRPRIATTCCGSEPAPRPRQAEHAAVGMNTSHLLLPRLGDVCGEGPGIHLLQGILRLNPLEVNHR